jgi:hypothetical protein
MDMVLADPDDEQVRPIVDGGTEGVGKHHIMHRLLSPVRPIVRPVLYKVGVWFRDHLHYVQVRFPRVMVDAVLRTRSIPAF